MGIEFTFNHNKAIEAILYIANRVEKADIPRILRLLYLADKAHLEQHARFIVGDSYVAMQYGPVPSEIYNMVKAVRGDKGSSSFYANKAEVSFSVEDEVIHPYRDANVNFFHPSDLDCLESVITMYGTKSFDELTEIGHDTAWENAWKSNNSHKAIKTEDIVEGSNNSNHILAQLQAPYDTGAPSIPPDDPIWNLGKNPVSYPEINERRYIYD